VGYSFKETNLSNTLVKYTYFWGYIKGHVGPDLALPWVKIEDKATKFGII